MQRDIKVSAVSPRKNFLNRYISIPKILLQGKWLEKSGFLIGEMVKVTITDNCITILKLQENERKNKNCTARP
jgi:hypothetical protein